MRIVRMAHNIRRKGPATIAAPAQLLTLSVAKRMGDRRESVRLSWSDA